MQKGGDFRTTTAALLALCTVLVAPASLRAAVVTYPGAAPCNTTLQACINAAAPGDTVELATNVPIAEFVTIDRSLVLQPATGFTPTLQGAFALATTTDVDVTVQRLTATLSTLDLAGGPRRIGVIDMGAYESAYGGLQTIPVLAPLQLLLLAFLVGLSAVLALRRS